MGHRALRKLKAAERVAAISNYHFANRIGIVYVANGESDFVLVKQFIKYLKGEYGIRHIGALAFVDSTEVPDYFLRAINQDWILQKNLKWNFRPFGESYDKFIQEPYDILIDLTNGDSLPMLFAQKESKAGFKVGKAGANNEEQFDLLIDVKEGDTFDKYLKKINYFLKMINQPKEKKEYAEI